MIVSTKIAIEASKSLNKKNKKIVLAGGCFDILHIGHIKFLKNAKGQADYLFVLLESDETVAKLKGAGRPINPQLDRAEILDSIKFVDYVILLTQMKSNNDYDELVKDINPSVIAITEGSKQQAHAKRQAEKINAKVISVVKNVEDVSTTKIAKIIIERFNK